MRIIEQPSKTPDELVLHIDPPRPIGSKAWLAYYAPGTGLQLARVKIYGWAESVSSSGFWGKDKPVVVSMNWEAQVFPTSDAPKARPSLLFDLKTDLLRRLSEGTSTQKSKEPLSPFPKDAPTPPLPIGETVWTWNRGTLDDALSLHPHLIQAKVHNWQYRITDRFGRSGDWYADVNDWQGVYHRPEHLFPTKEALLDYLDRTAIDLTNS